jgi:glyoxylase-like metal-dependent hydrolase (beta-lactamase superfamily II)
MVKAIVNYYTENTYIISEGLDAYIIDPGAHVDEIRRYIDGEGLRVKGILLTHGHFDHLYSINEVFDRYPCEVHLHESERDFLFDPILNLSTTIPTPVTFRRKKSIRTLHDGDVLPLGEETIQVIHTPGHSRGGVCYRYKQFLFSGDTLFKGTVGRPDLPTGSMTQLEQSLVRLLSMVSDNTVVYPGHGQYTTILSEKYENPYVRPLVRQDR